MKTISLDLHDFSLENNQFFFLNKLKDQYPNLKISMFYIPADLKYHAKLMDEERELVREQIRQAVNDGWIELIPHGLIHIFGEVAKSTYNDMELILDAYEEHFKEMGLPYVKGFCAPNWLISSEAIEALDDHGYWLAIDRNQPDCLKAKENYVYDWDIADPFPSKDNVKGHGHISLPSKNALDECMTNLSQIPSDYQWKFVSEVVESERSRIQKQGSIPKRQIKQKSKQKEERKEK